MMTCPEHALPWIRSPIRPQAVFHTRHQASRLTLARFRETDPAERVHHGRIENAVVAVLTIGAEPDHEFYHDEKLFPRGRQPAPVKFADLNADAYCRIRGPLDNLHLHMPRTVIDDVAHEDGTPPAEGLLTPRSAHTADVVLDSLKQALVAVTDRPREADQLLVDHLVLAVYAHLVGTYGRREAALSKTGGLATWQERRAKEMIAAHLSTEVSIAEVADACGLSATHFSRAFKTSTGTTPYGWLQECRIRQAMEMMGRGDLPLSEIAQACGFADQSHFTRVFNRVAGHTPAAWRRERRAA